MREKQMKERGFSVLRREERFQWKNGHKYYYNNTLFMSRSLSHTMIDYL